MNDTGKTLRGLTFSQSFSTVLMSSGRRVEPEQEEQELDGWMDCRSAG